MAHRENETNMVFTKESFFKYLEDMNIEGVEMEIEFQLDRGDYYQLPDVRTGCIYSPIPQQIMHYSEKPGPILMNLKIHTKDTK